MKSISNANAEAIRKALDPKQRKEIARVLRGMLKIARLAMPDTYYATDSRVRACKNLLGELAGLNFDD